MRDDDGTTFEEKEYDGSGNSVESAGTLPFFPQAGFVSRAPPLFLPSTVAVEEEEEVEEEVEVLGLRDGIRGLS